MPLERNASNFLFDDLAAQNTSVGKKGSARNPQETFGTLVLPTTDAIYSSFCLISFSLDIRAVDIGCPREECRLNGVSTAFQVL